MVLNFPGHREVSSFTSMAHVHQPPMKVGQFTATKTHDDVERWVCIYPAYMNSKKTRSEGRIIAKDKAVENPNFQEIQAVLNEGGFEFLLENKLYPRERRKENEFIGRFRVHLKTAEGESVKEGFDTREEVMLFICSKIPLLKVRTNPPKVGSAEREISHQASGGGGGGGGKGKGKKGKK